MISGTRYRMDADIGRQARLSQTLQREQTNISTGTRLRTPSDDPAASARISQLARAKANQTTWASNVETASSQATQVDSTLDSMQTQIDRARELMLAGSNGTLNAGDRATLAVELRGIVENLSSSMVQADSRGQPLFPEGDPIQIPISDSVRVTATLSRAKLFGGVETASGPRDLTAIISAAADALETADATQRTTAVTASLDEIDDAVSHLATTRADQGVRGARIDAVREQLVTLGTGQEEERSALEDTDLAAALARVTATKLSLDAAQAVFAKLNKGTLFDLLS